MAPDSTGTLVTAGDVAIVRIAGEIDLAAAEPLRPVFDQAAAHEGALVVLDLSAVRYLDSCGVRLLFELRRRMMPGTRLAAVVPKDAFIRKVLELVDLPSVVPVYETIEDAAAEG